ncbi:MAG: hypothetical protein FWF67_02700, partial [Fibromonadales bacterium]|nr:hypothetical protein [Fibromonadales bacterium]
GNEIDCIIDNGSNIKSIEIKSSSTISSDFFKGLNFYKNLNKTSEQYLVYGGKTNTSRNGIEIVNWKNILSIL